MTIAPPRRTGDDADPAFDSSTRTALEMIATVVTEMAGFEVAAISIATGDELEVVAVSGHDGARAALQGSRSAIDLTQRLIELADDWGQLRFVPQDRSCHYLARNGWIPDHDPLLVPDAWDPGDMLFAPFFDATGDLVGLLAVDLPSDGLRPDLERRALLSRYAAQAGRAVQVAHERASLAAHLDLASRARQAIRAASRDMSLESLLVECQEDLVAGFRAGGMWTHIIDGGTDGEGRDVVFVPGSRPLDSRPDEIIDIAREAARRAWAKGRVDVVSVGRVEGCENPPDEMSLFTSTMASIGVSSSLFVPLGEGRTCLGFLVLSRGYGDPDWTRTELDVALDVGRDLGHAISHARAFEREQSLVRELQAVDEYRSQLITTLSHELKTPLTAILSNLEMLDHPAAQRSDDDRRGLVAIDRGARRLHRTVEDLMVLAKIGDPANPLIPCPIDLVALVEDVLTLTETATRQRSLQVDLVHADGPVVARGDAGELDRVVTNLVSNAVKYTDQGGHIELCLERRGDVVVLTCTDDGIGISAEDQRGLFREFFRSTNPAALRVPGTGLGLTIVERIVHRHGGQISVASRLGEGTVFSVTLPAVDPG